MITELFDDTSLVTPAGHRTVMQGAHRTDSARVISRIKSSNPRLFTKMGLSVFTTQKLRFDNRLCRMVLKDNTDKVDAWATPQYYILKINGKFWYLLRNGL